MNFAKIARTGALGAVAGALTLGFAAPSQAQQSVRESLRESTKEVVISSLPSAFNLQATGDRGVAGVTSNGAIASCVETTGGMAQYATVNCQGLMNITSTADGFTTGFFDTSLVFAAAQSDMPESIDPTVVIGGGYSFEVSSLALGSTYAGGAHKLSASDRSGGDLLNFGVVSGEGGCTDRGNSSLGLVNSGQPLLPMSDCPATHPDAGFGGEDGINDAHPIPLESYLQIVQGDSLPDPFAFWEVETQFPELQDTTKLLGTWQTYGEVSDHFLDVISTGDQTYGSVTPQGTGDPVLGGWPLGLTTYFNAFYYALPALGNTLFWQGTIVNNSAEVYPAVGGTTFDSLYVGIHFDPLITQNTAHYFDPDRNTIFLANKGTNPNCESFASSGRCSDGFEDGAIGITFLKTPIGDMRYELFTESGNEFYDPANPLRDDTLTVNNQRVCGYGGCTNKANSSMRASFGKLSSTGVNLLDGRSVSDFSAGEYLHIFRNDFNNRSGQFNKYVPGGWDWNEDGIQDTLYMDTCDATGCVTVWSDTSIRGARVQFGFNNVGSVGTIGPVHMEPGDTVAFVLAITGAEDSIAIETQVTNAINFYKTFYLAPEAAQQPSFLAADVQTGSIRNATVTLYWGDATENWRDEYLANQLEAIDAGEVPDAALNPWLRDTVASLVTDNVAALYIFKSCDGGESFTDDGNCIGDPVNSATSKWASFGWEPYATLEVDGDGSLPNSFEDEDITAGVTYTYTLVTETRGAEFEVVRQPSAGNYESADLILVPGLFSPLSSVATNAYVTEVYVPTGLVAGGARAAVVDTTRASNSNIPIEFNVIGTAPQGGEFEIFFADSIKVTEIDSVVAGSAVLTRTEVNAMQVRRQADSPSDTDTILDPLIIGSSTFHRPGTAPALSGLSSVVVDTVPVVVDGDTVASKVRRARSTAGGLAMVLLNSGGNRPLLVSATLEEDGTTPGSFYGQPDFPYFGLGIDQAGLATTFGDVEFYNANGDTLADRVSPSVTWDESSALAGSQYGTYHVTWEAHPYGPRGTFDIRNLDELQANLTESLNSRVVASQSMAVDTGTALGDALGIGEAVESYALPFTIRNQSYDRSARVVVLSHSDSIRFGQSSDTARVAVPENVWVPGDELRLVETVQVEQVVDGITQVDTNGDPVLVTDTVVTTLLVLGCGDPCDPTFGSENASGFINTQPGTVLEAPYYVPFSGGDRVSFTFNKAIDAKEVIAAGGPVDLSKVHVVPNPYLVASQFERQTEDRVIKFTHLPPEGRIRIYDIAGRFIQEINFTDEDLRGGNLSWNLLTHEGLALGSGLYIFVLESDFGRKMGKFVVIR